MSEQKVKAVPAGYPPLKSCGAELIGIYDRPRRMALEQRSTIGALGDKEVVRITRWRMNPVTVLPTGCTIDSEMSALHVIVGLAEPHAEGPFAGHKVLDQMDDGKILLLEVLSKEDWLQHREGGEDGEDMRLKCDLLDCRLRRLQQSADVLWAEANYLPIAQGGGLTAPNDPAFGDQWGLQAVKAPQAWATFNGADLPRTVVAIVDSGIDYRHLDLAENLLPIRGLPVRFHCFDAEAREEGVAITHEAFRFDPNDPEAAALMDEEHSHGTFCAGVVGAVAHNARGIIGMHHKAALMPLKFIGPHGSGTVWDASQAIRAAVDRGSHLILAAWGTSTFSHCLYRTCQYAQEKGVLIVTAAGNLGEDLDRQRFYPACYKLENGPFPKTDHPYTCKHCDHAGSAGKGKRGKGKKAEPASGAEAKTPFYEGLDNIIVVGATEGYGFTRDGLENGCEQREQKTQSSNWGREVVDLGAPGHFIRSTRKNHVSHSNTRGSRLGWVGGTSMAAAFVAGALALIKARYHRDDYQQLKHRLLGTAEPVPALDPYWAYGRRLNVYRAVEARYDGYGGYAMQGETVNGVAEDGQHPEDAMDVAVLVRARNGNGKPAAAEGQNGRANGHGHGDGSGHGTPAHGGHGHSAHGH
jgi:subtilisin family serine protease